MSLFQTDEHEHIKNLKARAKKRSDEINEARELEKKEKAREERISEAPKGKMQDFWCDGCSKDVVLFAQKTIESDWTNKSQRIAYYGAQCVCGNIVKRYITDSWMDPYYLHSEELNKQRKEHQKDILQPHESGYSMLYGNK